MKNYKNYKIKNLDGIIKEIKEDKYITKDKEEYFKLILKVEFSTDTVNDLIEFFCGVSVDYTVCGIYALHSPRFQIDMDHPFRGVKNIEIDLRHGLSTYHIYNIYEQEHKKQKRIAENLINRTTNFYMEYETKEMTKEIYDVMEEKGIMDVTHSYAYLIDVNRTVGIWRYESTRSNFDKHKYIDKLSEKFGKKNLLTL